jgi:hypothetical protein
MNSEVCSFPLQEEKNKRKWSKTELFSVVREDEIGLDMPRTFTYHTQPQQWSDCLRRKRNGVVRARQES